MKISEAHKQCFEFSDSKVLAMQPLMQLKDKGEKKQMLEKILQQQFVCQEQNEKLCNLYAEAVGVDAHTASGIQKESTLHLVKRLRGGMFHESSGRQGFEPVPMQPPDREQLELAQLHS